jgi:hypothetical protein
MELIKVLLMFGTPGIVAAIARGRLWRKFAWYAGTVVFAIFALVFVDALYSGRHQLVSIAVLLSANFLMICLASLTVNNSK